MSLSNRELGTNVGKNAIHRIVLFRFALLSSFFLFREGDTLRRQGLAASHRIFGPRGERIRRQMIASIHGTVNGLVLDEDGVLGTVYLFTGVPHAILLGAFTAVAAIIPFAAAAALILMDAALMATTIHLDDIKQGELIKSQSQFRPVWLSNNSI